MCNCSVVAQIRTLDPFFFPTPLLQLCLSLGLAVDCVWMFLSVFFAQETLIFWERRGTAAAGSSSGSLRAGAGGGSVLDGQVTVGSTWLQGLGAQTFMC